VGTVVRVVVEKEGKAMPMTRPDQCPACGSFYSAALNKDGSRYNPFLDRAEQVAKHGQPLWESLKCENCGHVWPFVIVEFL
jgi:uncharacterized Zn finger protein